MISRLEKESFFRRLLYAASCLEKSQAKKTAILLIFWRNSVM